MTTRISKFFSKCILSGLLFYLPTSFLFAQEIKVSGNVSSLDEGSLPGVNILIQGTNKGTVSDKEGNYNIVVPDSEAVLVYTSVGYISQEVAVGNQSFISIELEADVTGLNEIIVIGYSSQSKKDITGAISTVDGETLNEVPAASFTEQLQGRATGVVVGQDNSPGGEPLVRIRGWGTINDNDPLYIIDGIPTKSDINAINPANIGSIQILKDAAAVSIYGARAANGVIIVTTKKGKPGTTKITFDARVGTQRPMNNNLNLLNTQELGEYYYMAYRNDYIAANGSDAGFVFNHGQYGPDPDAPDFIPDYTTPNKAFEGDPGTDPDDYSLDPDNYNGITRANKEGTDWYDEVFNPAPIQEYNLGINGGNESARYFVSFNYFDQKGIVKNTGYKRGTFRVNTEFAPKKWLRIGETFEASLITSFNIPNTSLFNPVVSVTSSIPILSVYDINGYYGSRRGADMMSSNPVARLDRLKDNVLNRRRLLGGAFIEADIVEGLTFKTLLGMDYRSNYISYFIPQALEVPTSSIENNLFVDYNNNVDWTWYNTLNYSKHFNNIHKLNILAGTEALSKKYTVLSAQRTNFYSSDPNYRYLDAGTAGINNSGSGSESSLFSLFAKVSYAYNDKYLFEATIRRDGSSRFSNNNRYATFPAFSIGWRLSEESFLNHLTWTTDLKLRASWGQMGNQEIADYNEFNTYRSSISQSAYDINGSNNSVKAGFDTQRFGNPNGRWETTTTLDIGFDWTLWNKLTINFDWYDMTTSDMLYQLNLPAMGGNAEYPFQNVGEMNNKGIDLGLTWNGSSSNGGLTYDIALNISHYKNEIISLGNNVAEGFFGSSIDNYSYTRNEAGVPYSSFYGYIIDGFTDGSEAEEVFEGYYGYVKGKFKYRDIDGDSVITDKDRTFIGNPHPDFTFGLSFNVYYKNFDFALFIQGSQGNEIINLVNGSTDFWSLTANSSKKARYESWTPELGDAAKLPIASTIDNISTRPSTYFIEDGSYLRLKNIQFGYTIPNLRGIDRLRIYIQVINLFTFTNYSGPDPEINISGTGSGLANLGLDRGFYPASQQFLIGVNFGF